MNAITYKIESFRTGETLVSFFRDGELSGQEIVTVNPMVAAEFAEGRVAEYNWLYTV